LEGSLGFGATFVRRFSRAFRGQLGFRGHFCRAFWQLVLAGHFGGQLKFRGHFCKAFWQGVLAGHFSKAAYIKLFL